MWSSNELCFNFTLKLAWFETWRRTLFAISIFCIYLFLQTYCLRLTSQYYVYSSTIHDIFSFSFFSTISIFIFSIDSIKSSFAFCAMIEFFVTFFMMTRNWAKVIDFILSFWLKNDKLNWTIVFCRKSICNFQKTQNRTTTRWFLTKCIWREQKINAQMKFVLYWKMTKFLKNQKDCDQK